MSKYTVWMTKQKEFVEEDEILTLDPVKDEVKLVVYNDDHNTFDWVIDCFVEVCNHTVVQSEQLSYMVHFRGKAIVKTGAKKVIKPMKEALLDSGLSAVIEE